MQHSTTEPRNDQPLRPLTGHSTNQGTSPQPVAVDRTMRQQIKGHDGKVVWLTGLSGSGKSTLAHALERELNALGRHTYLLDGDTIRRGLNSDLGFSDADRMENIRRVTEVAQLMFDAGLIVLVALISPFRRERDIARQRLGAGNFIEVHMSASLAVCEARDIKGLYQRARKGQLPDMTGIGSAYEAPLQPEVRIDSGNVDLGTAVGMLMEALQTAPADGRPAA